MSTVWQWFCSHIVQCNEKRASAQGWLLRLRKRVGLQDTSSTPKALALRARVPMLCRLLMLWTMTKHLARSRPTSTASSSSRQDITRSSLKRCSLHSTSKEFQHMLNFRLHSIPQHHLTAGDPRGTCISRICIIRAFNTPSGGVRPTRMMVFTGVEYISRRWRTS